MSDNASGPLVTSVQTSSLPLPLAQPASALLPISGGLPFLPPSFPASLAFATSLATASTIADVPLGLPLPLPGLRVEIPNIHSPAPGSTPSNEDTRFRVLQDATECALQGVQAQATQLSDLQEQHLMVIAERKAAKAEFEEARLANSTTRFLQKLPVLNDECQSRSELYRKGAGYIHTTLTIASDFSPLTEEHISQVKANLEAALRMNLLGIQMGAVKQRTNDWKQAEAVKDHLMQFADTLEVHEKFEFSKFNWAQYHSNVHDKAVKHMPKSVEKRRPSGFDNRPGGYDPRPRDGGSYGGRQGGAGGYGGGYGGGFDSRDPKRGKVCFSW
jgi:hypothetical protein